ncbi:MAG: spore gernimation protein, partial [Firmicutes bacterium]|nr:spore gernimation protein [Bacillota bacterium]
GYRFLMVIYYILVLIGANVYITNVPLTRWLLNVPLAILLYAMALVIPLLLYLVAKLRGYPRQQTK